MEITRTLLDDLYRNYNRRRFVHPDPLEFLYAYPDIRDREIVALIASSLAYGRVAQILKSVGFVLGELGPAPYAFLEDASGRRLERTFSTFRHRFCSGADLVSLLRGITKALSAHGSLNACFAAGIAGPGGNILPALQRFVAELGAGNHLLPSPSAGSACKRLNLFLRWMVRKDAVDPGGWHGVSKADLVVPLDTHMARIARAFGITRRKSADMRTALEITAFFRKISPADPVKYDFALTRFGIRGDFPKLPELGRKRNA